MYDLTKLPSISHHLSSIAGGMWVDKGSHYNSFCPFCDDQTRKYNPSHGHLYVAKILPVFICHRCSASGSILKLLAFTNFDDQETLNYLRSILKFNFSKDYFSSNKPKIKQTTQQLSKVITEKIKSVDENSLNIFNSYLYSRLGTINYSKFLLYPEFIQPNDKINQKVLSVAFNNSLNNYCGARLINQIGKIRYKTQKDAYYFFQPYDFENINNIIISEGLFDILNIYLYNNTFSHRDSFYMSISGKNYISAIEKLICQELLIGKFNINLIIDIDEKYNTSNSTKTYINILKYKAEKICNKLNQNISISIYKPVEGLKDIGEYPLLIKCD